MCILADGVRVTSRYIHIELWYFSQYYELIFLYESKQWDEAQPIYMNLRKEYIRMQIKYKYCLNPKHTGLFATLFIPEVDKFVHQLYRDIECPDKKM